MSKLLTILSRALSAVAYPLFIPTYGMVLYCLCYHTMTPMLPVGAYIYYGVATFILTCLIPLITILILIRKHVITDIYITNADERRLPYLITMMCYAIWCIVVIRTMQVLPAVRLSVIGATMAICIVNFINSYWKISAHLTGIGGLIGAFILYQPLIGCILLAVALLLIYARLYLDAHTPLQVVCGFGLGLLCTLIPNLIYYV